MKLIPIYSIEVKQALRQLDILEEKEKAKIKSNLLNTKFSDELSDGFDKCYKEELFYNTIISDIRIERERVKSLAIPVDYTIGE